VAQGMWGTEVPRRVPGFRKLTHSGYLAANPCTIFVYLAKVHEPLVKHEKNLDRSSCLYADLSSN